MSTFLGKLAAEIRDQQHPGPVCVVFSTKRAPVFFHDEYAKLLTSAGPVPDALSFEEFIREISGTVFPDTLTLAFELYPSYRKIFPDEPFDKFYSWAGVLLAGFEECRNALAEVKSVFRSIRELKELDETIESWDQGGETDPESFRARFLQLWQSVPQMHDELMERMKLLGLSTPGMTLQKLADENAPLPQMPWNKIWFAGFGAFTAAEEKFVYRLVDAGLAEVRWDADDYYLQNPVQEAGRYYRQLMERRQLKTLPGAENHLLKGEKQIKVLSVAGRTAQAKVAALELEQIKESRIGKNTAVILADESLLFPLLHALPESVEEINVTMGYPLRGTPVFALTDAVLQVHESAAAMTASRGTWQFYHRDVTGLLRHPYFKTLCREAGVHLQNKIKTENLVYLTPDQIAEETAGFEDAELLRAVFSQPASPQALVQVFMQVMDVLRELLENRAGEKGIRNDTELELLFHFRSLIVRLRDRLHEFENNVDLKTFRRLFRELIRSATVPFTGEPLSGLQVMGVLESRALDFDHLLVLSVNEGVLPGGSRNETFIPFSVRKAFGLPTYEDRDALFAWNFYRLLHRANHVTLIYNTESDVVGGGEKSRFLTQLETELLRVNPHIQWEEKHVSYGSIPGPLQPIQVIKSPAILEKLRTHSVEKGFSPSALNSYLACTLQFYLRYVEGLREQDEVEESAEGSTFGSVFHGLMERLYRPLVGKMVQAAELEQAKEQIKVIAPEVFRELARTRNLDYGKNHLLLGVVEELALKTVEMDVAQAPFYLHALEKPIEQVIETPDGPVKLRGIVDRVDEIGGTVRIVDYKTGDTGSLHLNDPAHAGENGQRKEAFQLATYALLFISEPSAPQPIRSGILSLRHLSKGIQLLEMGVTGETSLDQGSMQIFRTRLMEIAGEILSPEVLFYQTEDDKNCMFCAYKEICNRQ